MRGSVRQDSDAERQLREFVALKRAEFAFKQRVERIRWEQESLVPAVRAYEQQLTAGTAEVLELPE